jgi:prolyl oligopeptidase
MKDEVRPMTTNTILAYPATPRHPVSDRYHGVVVTEDYRWLERFDDPAVRTWNAEQNRLTRDVLDRVPFRDQLARELRRLLAEGSVNYYALQAVAGRVFVLKSQPPKNQPLLVVLDSADDRESERVVLDPNDLDPDGTIAIDFFKPSPDGRLIAISLSERGSEEGTLHVYEVATGRELGDLIPRVTYPTGGGSVAWNGDGTGLYYTRYPRAGERPPEDLNFYQQVYYHTLGTPESADTYVIGADFPRIAEVVLERSDDGRYLLATVANGDGGEFAHYVRGQDGAWSQVTRFDDHVKQVRFGHDDALYLLSHAGAPNGKLLRVPLATPALANAREVVPERDVAIQSFEPVATRLYVTQMVGGPSRICVVGLDGSDRGLLPIESIAAINQLVTLEGDTILYQHTTYTSPPAWYRFDPAEEEPARTQLFATSPADFRDVEIVRAFATSKDGMHVPISIVRREGTLLDGTNPTLLYAYGGYGICVAPFFDPGLAVWLRNGGVVAVANLRGGGEYGEAWHLAGNLTRKQNVFDDFLSCAEFLIGAGYTRPERLAVMGGSNGGLLMGAALTQRPDLFRAAATFVGIYDMLRVELDPNGAFNVTEFGTVADPEQFHALHSYSPYHHVVDGVAYPAVLFVTGDNDGRVNPAHSRKMVARLQAATSSRLPVLLRTSAAAGHGMGTSLSERIAEETDLYAFLFDQLDMTYSP